jgi:hypothetical protein
VDDKQYVFAYRSLSVRMRTASHFKTWYHRVLSKGMSTGVVHSYRTKPHHQPWPGVEEGNNVQRGVALGIPGQSANGKGSKSQCGSSSPTDIFFAGGNGLLLDHNSHNSTCGTDSTNGESNQSSNSPSSGSGDDNNCSNNGSTNGDSDHCARDGQSSAASAGGV